MRNYTQLLSIGAIGFVPCSSAAQDTDNSAFFLMTGTQIECLAQNAEQYLSSSEDTLFIKPRDCGSDKTGQTISFTEMTLNAAPDIRIVEDQNVPDEIVVLTHQDLICIANQALLPSASLVAFYPDGCHVIVRIP